MSIDNNKYNNGKIYKIVAYETNDVYIGSTIRSLKTRYSAHKSSFKYWINTKKHYCSSAKMFERHGLDNCKIELIENCVCNNKNELEGREAYFIEEYDDSCVNSNKPCRTKAQYYVDNKDKIKEHRRQYYVDNKDKFVQYIADNKDRINEYSAQYYTDNKNKIAARIKQYQDNNKNKIAANKKIKFDCHCGGKYTTGSKAKHIKTERHQKYLINV
jgi:gas vesicle protein